MTVNFQGRNIYSQNTPQQKQNDTKNSAAGVAAGVGTYLFGKQFIALPANGIMLNMKKINSSLSAEMSQICYLTLLKQLSKKADLKEKAFGY